MLEKISHIIMLKDFYGPLLTPKQLEILSLYYENDLSFSEIAAEIEISRQAVYDIVKRSETLLEEFENKLGLVKRFKESRQQLKKIHAMVSNAEWDNDSRQVLLQEIEILMNCL